MTNRPHPFSSKCTNSKSSDVHAHSYTFSFYMAKTNVNSRFKCWRTKRGFKNIHMPPRAHVFFLLSLILTYDACELYFTANKLVGVKCTLILSDSLNNHFEHSSIERRLSSFVLKDIERLSFYMQSTNRCPHELYWAKYSYIRK